jgi:predicted AlkP superfamily phosphohydrolase/phosphomutase
MAKVFVLGIDGAPPQFVLDKWLNILPNMKKLAENGAFGRIKSTIPPSTCIAWPSFFSGRCASDFGVYTYTRRDDTFSYSHNNLIDSSDIKVDLIWDTLTKLGKKSYVLGVPLTYPIKNEINGAMITGFLTPEFSDKSVYPKEFKQEIKSIIKNDYMFDVNTGLASYKNMAKDDMIEKIYEMTRQQFTLIKNLIKKNDWDFATTILIGTDRLEHTIWAEIDETHKEHKENKYINTLKDYFIYIDKQLGEVLELLDDDTTIIVSSDHGMDKMNFRFNVNDWLIKEGYLVLKEEVKGPVKFNPDLVDWSKTKAYATGFYFGMIYINLEGREPQGIVPLEGYDALQKEIASKIKQIKGQDGEELDTQVHLPQELFSGEYAEYAPDIIMHLDNLHAGTNSELGCPTLYSERTLVGKDYAAHAMLGTFIISGKGIPKKGDINTINIYDVAPTILSKLNVKIPEGLKGKELDFS